MNETLKRQWNLSRNWLEIDLDAAWHNARTLRQMLPRDTSIIAVVKDNAYGHGAYPIAKALIEGGVNQLAVSTLEEGMELRRYGIRVPILILSPVNSRSFRELLDYDLMPTIINLAQARPLAARAKAKGVQLPFHLKVDVGLNRYGLKAHDLKSVDEAEAILRLKGLRCVGTFTHLPSADDPSKDQMTRSEVELFTAFCHMLESRGLTIGKRHVANSATSLRFPEYAFDCIRPGLILYGVLPEGCEAWAGKFKPVMRWKAEITQVFDIPQGDGVSYNLTWEAPKAGKIAVLGVGYGDGYPRSWSPGAYVHPSVHPSIIKEQNLSETMKKIASSGDDEDSDDATENATEDEAAETIESKSQKALQSLNAEVVGRICMDATMVHLPDEPIARYIYRPGTEVTLMGGDEGAPRIEELAKLEGTIPYEIMTRINGRVPRLYFSKQHPFMRSTETREYRKANKR